MNLLYFQIVQVDPEGLAASFGLPVKASTMDGQGLCNWVLTEINSRTLNLFFKDNEVSIDNTVIS